MLKAKERKGWLSRFAPFDTLYASWLRNHNQAISTLGDSITAGSGASSNPTAWWSLLSAIVQALPGFSATNTLWHNNGFGGYSTNDLLHTGSPTPLQTVIGQAPALVLLQCPIDNDHAQNLTLAATAANLASLRNQLVTSLPKTRVILWLPNPQSPDNAGSNGLYQADYANAARGLCASEGWELIDIYDYFVLRAGGPGSVATYLADGTHPNDTGQTFLRDGLRNYLQHRNLLF